MQLFIQDTAGSYLPAADDVIVKAAHAVTGKKFRRGATLTSPRAMIEFLTVRYAGLEHEVFIVIFLDTRHRLIAVEEMFRGTIDGASVHPREVVKATLRHNAAAVVFAHNHPSGNPEPSQADELITKRLQQAMSLIEVRVLDHIVIAHDFCTSFAERGLL